MASTSETGHAVNVANLNKMISRIKGYGARYNPTNNLIKKPALQTLYTNAKKLLSALKPVKSTFIDKVNDRQEIFQAMEKLATRIINAFNATQAVTDKMVDDAKTIIRKIRGARKSKKILNPGPEDPNQISTSQQSFTQQLEHYSALIALVASEPTYKPNEAELKNARLNTFKTQLTKANNNAINATTPYLQAIEKRNKVLYTPKTGLVDVAQEAKAYVKSVSTITLPEFRQISGLKFTRPKKKK